jgi:hypothetical protein
MAIVRWREDGSEVYVYRTNEDGIYNCQHIDPAWPTFSGDGYDLLHHLRKCRESGMVVPEWVLDEVAYAFRVDQLINEPPPETHEEPSLPSHDDLRDQGYWTDEW